MSVSFLAQVKGIEIKQPAGGDSLCQKAAPSRGPFVPSSEVFDD
jgi:hypothetical protein